MTYMTYINYMTQTRGMGCIASHIMARYHHTHIQIHLKYPSIWTKKDKNTCNIGEESIREHWNQKEIPIETQLKMNEISINIQLKLKENSIKPNPNPITYTTVEYTSKSLTTLINSEEEKQIHKQSVSLDVIVRYKTMQWLESIKT
eukprot:639278_1